MNAIYVRRRFSLVLVLSIAAALGWWVSRGPEDLLFPPKPMLRHEPDYILEDFTMTSAGDDGLPRYRMTGTMMTHYPDTDAAQVDKPRLEFITAAGERWIITAMQAQAEQKGDFVKLRGEVSVVRDDQLGQGQGPVSATASALKTGSLDVYVNEGYADTDDDVVITQTLGVTRAQGLRINFRQRHLYLKSRVRGEYVLPAS